LGDIQKGGQKIQQFFNNTKSKKQNLILLIR